MAAASCGCRSSVLIGKPGKMSLITKTVVVLLLILHCTQVNAKPKPPGEKPKEEAPLVPTAALKEVAPKEAAPAAPKEAAPKAEDKPKKEQIEKPPEHKEKKTINDHVGDAPPPENPSAHVVPVQPAAPAQPAAPELAAQAKPAENVNPEEHHIDLPEDHGEEPATDPHGKEPEEHAAVTKPEEHPTDPPKPEEHPTDPPKSLPEEHPVETPHVEDGGVPHDEPPHDEPPHDEPPHGKPKKEKKKGKKGKKGERILEKQLKNEEPGFLYKNPKCQEDIEKYCGKMKASRHTDLQVVRCLQDALEREDDITEDCEQEMWEFKLNLTRNPLLDAGAKKLCPESLESVKECMVEHANKKDGFLANCLVEHREEVHEEKCHKFLKTLATVIFSDYRLIHGFYEDCLEDTKKLKCGMISISRDKDEEKPPTHEQQDVIGCLNSDLDKVGGKCKKQLIRVAELQADDYHLDRPLFYACQEPRERYCHEVKSGEGQVYKCLLQHINEELMPTECREKLEERQHLMQESKKTNYALWHHCKADFEKYGCEQIGLSEHGEASNLLLCLQEQIAEGKPVAPNCRAEMRDIATMIFDNYKISPIIVAGCDAEINTHCKAHIGASDNGAMMDCLMTIAATNDSLSKPCFESVTMVLKETGAGNNYKVDRALYVACETAISSLCNHKDDTLIMGCLMDNVHSPKMPESCSTQVFHLQYFLSRDFRLDASLYNDCADDAKKICHAADFNAKSETTNQNKMPHNFVIACLYRNIFMHDEVGIEVEPKCAEQVKRIMHNRANNVKLHPEVHDLCMTELGKHCSQKMGPEEELECLQENYEQLSGECQVAVKEFSQLEGRDFDLNYHLANKCGAMASKFCKRELEEEDGEKVIPCLIDNKNDIEMDHQCADAIEHWQLLEMKDISFSPQFNRVCVGEVRKICKESKSKTEAIKCLSQNIVQDASKVSLECRTQLKKELIKQTENIKLMPELYKACEKDLKKWCAQVPPGGAQMEECLRKNHHKLQSAECKAFLFDEETVEAQDPDLDYRLMHVCKPMIKRYCMSYSHPQEIVECLRQNTHDREMSVECREIIKERQIEQAESFVLDAELSNYCKVEAEKYCHKELEDGKKKGSDEGGEVFGCLVDNLMKKMKMSSDCENFIRRREAEAAMDLELNPQIFQHCHDEMSRVCPNTQPDEMIDCLKANIPKIKSKACVEEVKKLIIEGIEDVHVDPHLEQTCSRDIRTFCQDMPKKSGNVVLCLIDVHKAKNLHLQAECDNFLTKRLSLYNLAKVNPATFDSITTVLEAVQNSPNRNSVYVSVMLILGVLFLGGIIFGRVTKKAHIDMKNR